MKFDQYIEGVKSFLLKRAVEKVFTIIVTKFTFLAWGPIGPLVKYILGKIIGLVIYETDMAIFFLYTDVRVNAQGREFYTAIEENLVIQEGTDEEAKKISEEKLVNSFRKLVKFTS